MIIISYTFTKKIMVPFPKLKSLQGLILHSDRLDYSEPEHLCSPKQDILAGDQPKDLNAKTFAPNAGNIKPMFYWKLGLR